MAVILLPTGAAFSSIAEALCLGKADVTTALHLLFMFGIVAFQTLYICRPAKTRFAVLLNQLNSNIPTNIWIDSPIDENWVSEKSFAREGPGSAA